MLKLEDTWEVGEFGASKGKGGCIVETSYFNLPECVYMYYLYQGMY